MLKELNITALFLPAYSPELNSIENLWGVSKKQLAYLIQQALISERPLKTNENFLELAREALVFDLEQV